MEIYKNASIKKLTKQVFNLEVPDYNVLGTIGRLGYLNKNQINEKLSSSTPRQIRWRIDKFLLPGEFLYVEEEKPYRNIKKAFKTKKRKGVKLTEKKYGLTFKGFLASLGFCPFNENYLIKKYRTWLTPEIENDALEYIQSHLILYFLTLKHHGIKLDSFTALFAHIRMTMLDIHTIGVSKSELESFSNIENEFRALDSKILKLANSKEGYDLIIIIRNWFNMIVDIISNRSRSETLDGWDEYYEFITS